MSAAAEGEEEPFEIQDFSVATPWEQLVGAVELHLREWAAASAAGRAPPAPLSLIAQLGGGGVTRTVCCILSCHGSLSCGDTATWSGRQPVICEELLHPQRSLRSDAFSIALPDRLHRWYGVKALVLLTPSEPQASLDASEMAALQSALCTAAGACDCAAPLFVLHESVSTGVCGRAMLFQPCAGGSLWGGLRAAASTATFRFDVKSYNPVPPVLRGKNALFALFHLFCAKVAAGGTVSTNEPISVAVRLTLVLDQWHGRALHYHRTRTIEQGLASVDADVQLMVGVSIPLTAWGTETRASGRRSARHQNTGWIPRAADDKYLVGCGMGLDGFALACEWRFELPPPRGWSRRLAGTVTNSEHPGRSGDKQGVPQPFPALPPPLLPTDAHTWRLRRMPLSTEEKAHHREILFGKHAAGAAAAVRWMLRGSAEAMALLHRAMEEDNTPEAGRAGRVVLGEGPRGEGGSSIEAPGRLVDTENTTDIFRGAGDQRQSPPLLSVRELITRIDLHANGGRPSDGTVAYAASSLQYVLKRDAITRRGGEGLTDDDFSQNTPGRSSGEMAHCSVRTFVGAPFLPHSLLCRLGAACLGTHTAARAKDGPKLPHAAALLLRAWCMLIDEARDSWERRSVLPYLPVSTPNEAGGASVQQKLVLLNYCIRESALERSAVGGVQRQAGDRSLPIPSSLLPCTPATRPCSPHKSQYDERDASPILSTSPAKEAKECKTSPSRSEDGEEDTIFQECEELEGDLFPEETAGNEAMSGQLSDSQQGQIEVASLSFRDGYAHDEARLDSTVSTPSSPVGATCSPALRSSGEGRRRPLSGFLGQVSGLLLWEPWTQDVGTFTACAADTSSSMSSPMASLRESSTRSTPGPSMSVSGSLPRYGPSRLQSAQLKSDMQAFKAANPGAVLEDFVRWRSLLDGSDASDGTRHVRDGDFRDGKGGACSELWLQLWSSTTALPAASQRPLFDPAREAHITLEELDADVDPGLLLAQLTLGSILELLVALDESPYAKVVPASHDLIQSLWDSAVHLLAVDGPVRTPRSEDGLTYGDSVALTAIDEFCIRLADLEALLASVTVLHERLPGQGNLVRALLGAPHQPGLCTSPLGTAQQLGAGMRSRVPDAEEVSTACEADDCSDVLLSDSARSLLSPTLLHGAGRRSDERTLHEYVFTANLARAATASSCIAAQASPQRMYAGVRDDQWRVAFALSETAE